MSTAEKIQFAGEKVSGLQDQLTTVESVLDKAEIIAVAGEEAGRKSRKLLKLLLVVGVIAVVVVVVKKMMAKDGADSIEAEFTPAPANTTPVAAAAPSDGSSDEDNDDDSEDDVSDEQS